MSKGKNEHRLLTCLTKAMVMMGIMVALSPTMAMAAQKGAWKGSGSWWWYRYKDGSYPAATMETIDGKDYYFDKSGWMAIGWRKVGGQWRWFQSSGAMAKNKWIWDGSAWYWMKKDGSMATGWLDQGRSTYWLKSSGAMATGWQRLSGKWYYFASSGAMYRSRWCGNYYLGKDGAMLTNTTTPDGYRVDANGKWIDSSSGWKRSGGRWWYRNSDGSYPKGGMSKVGGKWYYFDNSGWMKTGWQKDGGKWYYFGSSGAMVANKWVGDYYLGPDGAMLTNTTTPDGYAVGADGKYLGKGHWEDVYETVKVPTGNKKWVVDKEAWDEEVYEKVTVWVFADGYEAKSLEEVREYGKKKYEETGEHINYSVVTRNELIDTIHHEEEGHYEDVFETQKIKVGTKWVVD